MSNQDTDPEALRAVMYHCIELGVAIADGQFHDLAAVKRALDARAASLEQQVRAAEAEGAVIDPAALPAIEWRIRDSLDSLFQQEGERRGECAMVAIEPTGAGVAALYLWQVEAVRLENVVEVLHLAGCGQVSVDQRLHCDVDGFRNGTHQDDDARAWNLSFTLGQGAASRVASETGARA